MTRSFSLFYFSVASAIGGRSRARWDPLLEYRRRGSHSAVAVGAKPRTATAIDCHTFSLRAAAALTRT